MLSNFFVQSLILILAVLDGVHAFWRLPCRGRSGLGLVDPIMDFGTASTHAHVLHGSSNFGIDATNADMMKGDCTSCGVKQDLSTYWTPILYFQYSNGTSVMVDEVGGMLAYYLLYGDDVTEFPQGFQMIAGSPNRRNFTCQQPEPPKSLWSGSEVTQDALSQKALGFNCLNYAIAPEPSLGRHGLPTKDFLNSNCPDGVRLELFFPSCWNGHDATAPDHQSHMAYPSLVNGGDCPSGFPTRVPSLFYETIWNTAAFKGQDGQFTLSNGDLTGYGYHGDFMAGWDDGFLQKAINTCTDPSGEVSACKLFDLNTDAEMQQCSMPRPPASAEPDCEGPLQGLPGDCELTKGPEPAVPKAPAGADSLPKPPTPPQPSSYALSVPPSSSLSSDPQSAAATRTGSSTGDLVFAQSATASPRPMPLSNFNVKVASSADTPPPSSTDVPVSMAEAPAAPSDVPAPVQDAPSAPAAAPAPPAPEPSTTAAPSLPSLAVGGTCAEYSTIHGNGEEWDICITDVTSYVTASTAPANAKRHIHEHNNHMRRRAGHAHI